MINQARNGGLKRQPGSSLVQTFEAKVNEALNKATNTAGKAVKQALKKMNNIKQMVEAGSKGNAINISQIIACVGQQNVQVSLWFSGMVSLLRVNELLLDSLIVRCLISRKVILVLKVVDSFPTRICKG